MKTIGSKRWILAAAILVVGGCSKLTYQNWETIHDGMSRDAVRATLGKPFSSSATDNAWVYSETDRGVAATIYFEGDKVSGKSWADAEHGMVGKSPNVNKPGESEEIKVQKLNK